MLSEAVIKEYRQLKEKYPKKVLLLQVGTFYKLLLDDARQLAGELGLKLITISKPEPVGRVAEHRSDLPTAPAGQAVASSEPEGTPAPFSWKDIAFCGFPVSGLDKYIGKLVRLGNDVIICNQIKVDGRIVNWEVKERIVLNNNGRLSD